MLFFAFAVGRLGGEVSIEKRRCLISDVPRRAVFIIVTKGCGLYMYSGGFRLALGLLNVGGAS